MPKDVILNTLGPKASARHGCLRRANPVPSAGPERGNSTKPPKGIKSFRLEPLDSSIPAQSTGSLLGNGFWSKVPSAVVRLGGFGCSRLPEGHAHEKHKR